MRFLLFKSLNKGCMFLYLRIVSLRDNLTLDSSAPPYALDNKPYQRHQQEDDRQHDAQQDLSQPRPSKTRVEAHWLVRVERSVDLASVEKGAQHVRPRLWLAVPEGFRMAKVFEDDLLAVPQVRQQFLGGKL